MTAQTVPLNGLAVEISANAKAGNSRFEIRLDPPELGRIDVRLDVDRNGQVTSRLFVEKSETLDLLRRDAPQLQHFITELGFAKAAPLGEGRRDWLDRMDDEHDNLRAAYEHLLAIGYLAVGPS